MPRKKAVLFASGAVFLVLFGLAAAFVYLAFAINKHIDLCDDPTSGRYIQDKDKRQEACSQWR
ncbi:hypothetical protein [Anderseniella sp. Alg231-50]|uniref:hypothetical protein n=1 Tax=Anderseniella sp. Alg231-50 TaxID=1922226 RepID=UPI000D5531AB